VRFRIFDGEDETDREVILRLIQGVSTAVVSVVACDTDGEPLPFGHLLSIQKEGVSLNTNVALDLGMSLDSEQRLKLLGGS